VNIGKSDGNLSIYNDSARPEVPDQLPLESRGFTDRTDAVAVLDALIGPGPVLTAIVGPAGTGKSALALHWSNLHPERFSDGILHVDLRGHEESEPLSVLQALGHLLDGLGVAEADQPADPELRAKRWRTLSARRDLLIILDNAADVEQILPLLSAGRRTTTIITSRDSLAALSVRARVEVIRLEPLDTEHAVALLRELIDPVRVEGAETDLRELAGLCANLPIALSIAAQSLAAAPLTPVADLCAQLREPGRRIDPVRAVFAACVGGLNEDAAGVFRLLGLNPAAEFCFEAAVALADRPPTAVRRCLEELMAVNLLTLRRPGWFVMHDLLHAYAAELAEHAGPDQPLARLGRWYAGTAAKAARVLEAGTSSADDARRGAVDQFVDAGAAQNWYAREQANFEVLCLRLAERGLAEEATSLASQVVDIYAFNNAFDPWFSVARLGARLAARAPDPIASAWFDEFLGKAHLQAGQSADARAHLDAALETRLESGDASGLARSHNALGLWHFREGDFAAAVDAFSTALSYASCARSADGTDFSVLARLNLGMTVLRQASTAGADQGVGLYGQALAHLDAAIELPGGAQASLTQVALQRGRAEALAGLGRIQEAASIAAESVRTARLLRNALFLAPSLASLARIHVLLGEIAPARAALGEALGILEGLADPRAMEYRSRLEQLPAPPER
jgi:tetratricopeptide (TPR) repeat protein